jgi:hypothetical protein
MSRSPRPRREGNCWDRAGPAVDTPLVCCYQLVTGPITNLNRIHEGIVACVLFDHLS